MISKNIYSVVVAVLLVTGCVEKSSHTIPEPNLVVALGCDISKTMNVRNIPAMTRQHLESLINIMSEKRSAELAFATIGAEKYPKIEQIQFFNVLDFPLDRRGAIQHEQNNRIGRFKSAVNPKIMWRKDNYTHLHSSLQLLATYLHQPRTTPVQKFLIVISDFQDDPAPARQQTLFGSGEETPKNSDVKTSLILLPMDVTILAVCPERGAADRYFQQPVEYFVDLDGLLIFLQQALEKKS